MEAIRKSVPVAPRRKPVPVIQRKKYEREPSIFEWGEWLTPARRSSRVELIDIPSFDARGMRWVFGRGEWYGRGLDFNLGIWLTEDNRLIARFSRGRRRINSKSVEIIGFFRKKLLTAASSDFYGNEVWAPWCLRSAYSNWIDEQMSKLKR